MNNIEDFRNYCLSFKGVTEKFPFDETTLVFYVMGKMFCLVDINDFDYCNLKCDPDEAQELRALYEGFKPGYHMNKKHWNTIICSGQLDNDEIFDLARLSYELVIKD